VSKIRLHAPELVLLFWTVILLAFGLGVVLDGVAMLTIAAAVAAQANENRRQDRFRRLR
jgi:hypothetical protein